MKHLKERGLGGVALIISDACVGLTESLAEYYPDARWQHCAVHFYLDAEVLIETFRQEYNRVRPHSSLNMLTPIEFKQQLLTTNP